MTLTKVRGVTAKRVLCENFADTSCSRLVFSRGGYCRLLDAAPAASTIIITCIHPSSLNIFPKWWTTGLGIEMMMIGRLVTKKTRTNMGTIWAHMRPVS